MFHLVMENIRDSGGGGGCGGVFVGGEGFGQCISLTTVITVF